MFPENALAAAAYLFEIANGNRLGEYEISEVERYGLSGGDE